MNSTRHQPSESLPTVIINDTDQYSYTKESVLDRDPKRLLVRIVKAVKLHGNYRSHFLLGFVFFLVSYKIDVEQPYCILELNHPRQIKRTDIAKNGLNPYVN